jgi:RimJ/RimL family protein N-acetyltransferase
MVSPGGSGQLHTPDARRVAPLRYRMGMESSSALPPPAPMPRPSGPYRTERLELRVFVADDLEAFMAMHSDPDTVRYVPYPPMSREQAADRLEQIARMTAIDDEAQNLRLALVLPNTGELIGDVSMWCPPHDRQQAEIGFVLNPRFHGHGYATEAVAELLRIGFEEAGLHRIVGNCDARNTASARVMERVGMRQEAHQIQNLYAKGEWTDELDFAILADEWRSR